jgi:hypothetical protein
MTEDRKKIVLQVRAPKGRDPGAIMEGYYTVVGNEVRLTDVGGRLIGRRTVDPGGDPKVVAIHMMRERRESGPARSFNRPLHYGPGWRGV